MIFPKKDLKMKKFFKGLIFIGLLLILGELFIGEYRLFSFNNRYSDEQRISYLCDLDHLIDGVPKPNIEILVQNNVKIENVKGFNEGNCCALVLSTKHFNFKLYNDGTQDIHTKKDDEQIIYDGNDYYDGTTYREDQTHNKVVNTKTKNLIKKELHEKLSKIGTDMNFQIYNYISSKYIKD